MSWKNETLVCRGRLSALAELTAEFEKLEGPVWPAQILNVLRRATEEVVATLPAPNSGPETSAKAAKSMTVKVGSLRFLALSAYLDGGLTDEEVGHRVSHPRIWPRCSELRTLGLIQPTGELRVVARTGQQCEVCEITQEGRAALQPASDG